MIHAVHELMFILHKNIWYLLQNYTHEFVKSPSSLTSTNIINQKRPLKNWLNTFPLIVNKIESGD